MALLVEDGSGISGADAYASRAAVLAYWVNRPHDTKAATVAAADVNDLDGAIREATDFADANWGPYYRGVRRGYVQGKLFPRTGAKDDAGYPLPDLPPELVAAVCELAARAVTSPLAADIDTGARVKSQTKKVGPLEKSTEYFDGGAAPQTAYGAVDNILAPLLNGSQPRAPNAHWSWA